MHCKFATCYISQDQITLLFKQKKVIILAGGIIGIIFLNYIKNLKFCSSKCGINFLIFSRVSFGIVTEFVQKKLKKWLFYIIVLNLQGGGRERGRVGFHSFSPKSSDGCDTVRLCLSFISNHMSQKLKSFLSFDLQKRVITVLELLILERKKKKTDY